MFWNSVQNCAFSAYLQLTPNVRTFILSGLNLRPAENAVVGSRRTGTRKLVANTCRHTAGLFLLPLIMACGSASRTSTVPLPATGAEAEILASERAAGTALGRALGVPPFSVDGRDSKLGPLSYALADLISADLSRSAQLTVVERTRLSDVLRELDLAESGKVDPSTSPRVGRLISANRLVLGGVQEMPAENQIRIGVRLADVQNGVVAQSIDAQAPLADILAAQKALVFRIFDALGIVLTPAERLAIEQRQTSDLAALLAYGSAVQAEYLGDFRKAASEYRRASRLDPQFRGASSRAQEVRARSETGVSLPVVMPGLKSRDAAVGTTIDRLNRPLDLITGGTKNTGSVADPSFPTSAATVIITVTRP